VANADALRERLRFGCRETLIRTAQYFTDEARLNAPVRTGFLRDSIVDPTVVDESETRVVVRIAAEADYAEHVEYPTQPHTIAASNAPLLVFYWADGPYGPGIYRFHEVNHPGTPGQPFLIPTPDQYTEELRTQFQQEPFFHLTG